MADNEQTVRINIRAETTRATDEVRRLNRQLGDMERTVRTSNTTTQAYTRQVRRLGSSFAELGGHLARVATYYAGFQAINGTIQTFAKFQQQISELGAVSGASVSQLGALKKEALSLGDSTVFSATQVSGAMINLSRSGLNEKQILASIKPVLNLAIVGHMDLADAAQKATDATHGFGMKAKDTGIVIDVMAKAANSSSQSVNDLSDAYVNAAPESVITNTSFTQLTATLEILANAGKRGSDAGTHLKIIMQRLNGDKQTKKYLDELSVASGGMSTKMFDASGNSKGLIAQLKVLKKAVAGLTPEMRNMYLTEIGGKEASATLLILLKNLDGIDKKVKVLNGSFGYSDTVSKQMMNNLTGDYKQLQSVLQTLEIKIGETLEPSLRKIIEDATNFVHSLDEKTINDFATSMGTLAREVGAVALLIGKVVFGITGAIGSFQDFTGVTDSTIAELVLFGLSIGKITKLFETLRLAMIASFGVEAGAMMATGIGSMIVVLAGLGLELHTIQSNFDDFNNATHKFLKSSTSFINEWKKIQKLGKEGTTADIAKELDSLNIKLKSSNDKIADYQKKIKDLKSQWFYRFSEDSKTEVKAYKIMIGSQKDYIEKIKMGEKALKKYGDTAEKVRLREIETQNKEANGQQKITEDAHKATEAQISGLDKVIKKNKERKKSAEATLKNLEEGEKNYTYDMIKLAIKLEKKRKEIHKKYADERVAINENFKNKIADLEQVGFTNLQKYNDNQLRADKALEKAKQAMKAGNLVQAKTYYAEVTRLASESAGQEISHTEKVSVYNAKTHKYEIKEIKKVDLTKKQTANNAIAYLKKEHNFAIKMSKIEEKRAIAKINLEMDLKKNQHKLVVAEINLQIQAIALMGKMITTTKGINWDEQLNRAKAKIRGIEKGIDDTFKKQRELKIKAITNPKNLDDEAHKITSTIEKKSKNTKVKTKVDLHTDDAQVKFTKFTVTSRKTGVTTDLLLHTNDAQKHFNALKMTITHSKPITKIGLNTSFAYTANRRLNTELSRPVTKIVHIKTVQASQNGGLILPRFQNGGHLDDGIGHVPMSGKLSGYGGGDRVKALLEDGEYIIKKEAVRTLGVDRLNTINQGKLPRYATGGLVGIGTPEKLIQEISNSMSSNDSSSSNGSSKDNKTIDFGDLIDKLNKLKDIFIAGGAKNKISEINDDITSIKDAKAKTKVEVDKVQKVSENEQAYKESIKGKTLSKEQYNTYLEKDKSLVNKSKTEKINLQSINDESQKVKDKIKSDIDKLNEYLKKIKDIKTTIKKRLSSLKMDRIFDGLDDSLDLNRLNKFNKELSRISNLQMTPAQGLSNVKREWETYEHDIYDFGFLKDQLLNAGEIEINGNTTTFRGDIYAKDFNKKLIPRFQTGGKLKGYGGGDRNLTLLEDGEFVVRKEAVSHFGDGLFHKLNSMAIPKFQTGGMIGNSGANINSTEAMNNVNLNFTMPSGNTYKAVSSSEVAKALGNELRKLQ